MSLLDTTADILAEALELLADHLNDERISEPLRLAATALRDAAAPENVAADVSPFFQPARPQPEV